MHIFLIGTLIDSRGNLGVTPSSRVTVDIFNSRAKIIRNLIDSLKDPKEACTETNILAILALVKTAPSQNLKPPLKTPKQGPLQSLQSLNSFSLSNIDPIHVDGLTKLIESKGGLEKIETPGLAPINTL